MNRLERLLNLVAALLDAGRPLSRSDIFDRVPGYGEGPSARRAFERDKEALRSMGIPLAVEPLDADHPERGDGYRVHRDRYELPDPGLEPDEVAALHLAASAVSMDGAPGTGADGGPAGSAMLKLGGAPPARPAETAAVASLAGHEHLPALFAAVTERRRAVFTYRGEQRSVDPHRLSSSGGRWYLAGYDHARSGERSFRVDRIESAPVLGGPGGFEHPPRTRAPATAPWRMGDEEAVEAELLVDAEQAGWAVARVGADAVGERRPDGSVVLRLEVTNRAAFRSFALGFLHHAEVLGPPAVRRDVTDWLLRVAGAADGGAPDAAGAGAGRS